MIRGTTPTIRFNFDTVTASEIEVAFLTVEQGGASMFERDVETMSVGDNYIEWHLTQAETLSLTAGISAKIQIRYRMPGTDAWASQIYSDVITDVLKEGVI